MESESFVLRDLEPDDYDKGYLELLSQLTTVGQISKDRFTDRLQELQLSNSYKVAVLEDTTRSRIAGTATLLVEKKFIHECGMVGHIEDVVVHHDYRGKGLGLKLIDALITAGQQLGCYKVILDCNESNVAFYAKCGLTKKEVQMVKYLDA